MMKEFQRDHVKNLPDVYRKDKDSNNFKILEVERFAVNELRQTLSEIEFILDFNNARGKTLDMWGKRLGQARGVATDEKYLLMIKARIARNISSGSYPDIINAVCLTLDCDPSEVVIVEDTEPCTVKIVALPLETVNRAGLSTSQLIAIVKSLLPSGVKLSTFTFDGTFELAHSYEDMTVDGSTKGLTDTYENMENPDAIGGYLGVTNSDERDEVLPI